MTSQTELLKTAKFSVVQRETSQGSVTHIRHPGAVVILPFVDENRICLIRNLRRTIDSRLIELPAGTLEPDESPTVTASRELAEETGYRAGNIEPLFDYFVSPGILDEKMHAFVATDLTPGTPHRMDDEDIENLVTPWDEAIAMIRRGEIQDAKTIATLLYYAQFVRTPAPTTP